MKLVIVLCLVFSVFAADKIKVWREKKGLVVLEAEHIQTRNRLPVYWESARPEQNFSGTGFLQWRGTSYLKDSLSQITDDRILTFYVSIEKEGNYYFKVKGICVDETEAHVALRVNSSVWERFIIPNNGKVNWDINPVKDSYPVFLPHGYHRIDVAGISAGFLFDRFIMVHESLLEVGDRAEFANSYFNEKESKSVYVDDELFPKR